LALQIGLLATIVICVQGYPFVLGFAWALIHGAGPSSFLAFLPTALGLAMLWAGYVFLKRRNITRMTLVFTIYALGIVMMNEVLLPATPLKMLWAQRAAEAVEVRSVRDDVLLSARGNPIGIRITFDAVVPRTGEYSISASSLSRVADEVFWPLNFGHVNRTVTDPPPPRGEDIYDVFQKGVVYRFTTDLLPAFLSFDEPDKEPCLVNVTTKYHSEADFLSALGKSRKMKYRGEIHVSNAHTMRSAVVHEYVTTRDYDVEAMYRTVGMEGNRRCGH
jgi:hypothetical protein